MPTTRQSVRLLASAPVRHWAARSLAGCPPEEDPTPPPPASTTITVMMSPRMPPPPPIVSPPPGIPENRPPAPRSSSICDVSSCASLRNLMRRLYPFPVEILRPDGTAHPQPGDMDRIHELADQWNARSS